MSEFDREPLPGLPEELPAGEYIVWRGKPQAWGVARHLLLLPYVAAYFIVLAAWSCRATVAAGESAMAATLAAFWLLVMGAAALAILGAFAYAVQRTTVYTITSRRIVVRYGLALPMAINIPFAQIEAAAVCNYANGAGSISLRMIQNQGLAYIFMWPHVRPWRMWAPQPMLACVADVATVSALLGRALAATSAGSVTQRQLEPRAETGWLPGQAHSPNGGLGAHS